jgi:hypothetical protein
MADAVAAKPADKIDTSAMKQAPTRALDRNFGLESFKYNSWAYDLEEPHTLENIADPSFWSTQAHKVIGHDKTKPKGRGDTLIVRDLRAGVYRKYLILEVGPGFMKLSLIEANKPEEVAIAKDSPLTVRWNKGKNLHEVIRKDDRSVLKSDFQTESAAAAWIADHLKQMAA